MDDVRGRLGDHRVRDRVVRRRSRRSSGCSRRAARSPRRATPRRRSSCSGSARSRLRGRRSPSTNFTFVAIAGVRDEHGSVLVARFPEPEAAGAAVGSRRLSPGAKLRCADRRAGPSLTTWAQPVRSLREHRLRPFARELTARSSRWGSRPSGPSRCGGSCGSAPLRTTRMPDVPQLRAAVWPLSSRSGSRCLRCGRRIGGRRGSRCCGSGRARRRDRLDGVSRTGHRVCLDADRVRDGVRVLRDGADGAEEQPDGGRDRGAGGVGSAAPRRAAGDRRRGGSRTSSSWGWASRSRTSGTRSAALERMTDPGAIGIGDRHITMSTVGVVPGIERLGERFPQVGLAVSLHASTDELRNELVPVNRLWPLAVSRTRWRLARAHPPPSVDRVGDDRSDERLGGSGRAARPDRDAAHAHVNLIPLNPTPGWPTQPSSRAGSGGSSRSSRTLGSRYGSGHPGPRDRGGVGTALPRARADGLDRPLTPRSDAAAPHPGAWLVGHGVSRA